MDRWSLSGLVSQRSLVTCRLEFEDRPVERASLFPFFDDDGRTRMVMITAAESARIMLADWSAGVFVRDWRRRNRVRLRFADLRDASMGDVDGFDDLWHFDPWWVLGEERYQGHGAVPALRSTNIPGYDAAVTKIVFARGLERASHVVTESAGSTRVRVFSADTLAAAARRRRAAHERARTEARIGWTLRPFWRSL